MFNFKNYKCMENLFCFEVKEVTSEKVVIEFLPNVAFKAMIAGRVIEFLPNDHVVICFGRNPKYHG